MVVFLGGTVSLGWDYIESKRMFICVKSRRRMKVVKELLFLREKLSSSWQLAWVGIAFVELQNSGFEQTSWIS